MRIVVADDHPLYIDAVQGQIRRIFPDAIIETAQTFQETLARLDTGEAQLVMMDLYMPGMEEGRGVAQVVAAAAPAPVIVISGSANDGDVRACIEAGARGFLPKTFGGPVFASAITLVMAGGSYVPAEFVALPSATPDSAGSSPGTPFTPREMEVLTLVVRGCSNKEIARTLSLQEVTIKLHLSRIFHKMGVKNRSHAAVMAVRNGLVPEDGTG
jgi:DNA-binding NarL/FixJ family response regulator